MSHFSTRENTNNILFVVMYALFLASVLLFPESAGTYFLASVFILLGATIYGFFSKNPLKSYLFGFSIPIVIEIQNSIYSHIVYSTPLFSGFISSLPIMILYSLIWGLPGCFAALKGSDKFQSVIYILLAFVFIFIQIALTFRTF